MEEMEFKTDLLHFTLDMLSINLMQMLLMQIISPSTLPFRTAVHAVCRTATEAG